MRPRFLGDAGTGNTVYGDTSVYAGALDAIQPGLSVTVSDAQQAGESWVDTLARVLPTLVLADNQRRVLNVQMERAAQGLPPLNTQQMGLGVNVGLSPQTIALIGLALAGVVGLAYLARPRR